MEVGEYRKPTHTVKQIFGFEWHSPENSETDVVKTLMDCAKCLTSTTEQEQDEKQQVINDLKVNRCPQQFLYSEEGCSCNQKFSF